MNILNYWRLLIGQCFEIVSKKYLQNFNSKIFLVLFSVFNNNSKAQLLGIILGPIILGSFPSAGWDVGFDIAELFFIVVEQICWTLLRADRVATARVKGSFAQSDWIISIFFVSAALVQDHRYVAKLTDRAVASSNCVIEVFIFRTTFQKYLSVQTVVIFFSVRVGWICVESICKISAVYSARILSCTDLIVQIIIRHRSRTGRVRRCCFQVGFFFWIRTVTGYKLLKLEIFVKLFASGIVGFGTAVKGVVGRSVTWLLGFVLGMVDSDVMRCCSVIGWNGFEMQAGIVFLAKQRLICELKNNPAVHC
ncbi:hypothetical protein T01_9220 [Trichinella spiralis]|uniref:Uncharacterized protein n=1 Tax=Trichinella spiralis TaxID=6334 RepID=A0A0V1BQG5_TRISP|nr:hypothetical protein T01_9220 [Trichinella spiralis]